MVYLDERLRRKLEERARLIAEKGMLPPAPPRTPGYITNSDAARIWDENERRRAIDEAEWQAYLAEQSYLAEHPEPDAA